MPLPLIDTHAHLDEIEDIERAIEEAKSSGVIAIVAVGSDIPSNLKVLELAARHPSFIFPALGLHPWSLPEANVEEELLFLETHMKEAVAIGEVGLDYVKSLVRKVGKERQKEVFGAILDLARRSEKPVIIHSRYAWRDAFELTKSKKIRKAVFHWYTGPLNVLREALLEGYFFSCSPAVLYHEEHRRVAKETPLAKLLLETDSPVVYARGTPHEFTSRPSDTRRVLEAVASLKGIQIEEAAIRTTENAIKLFGLRLKL